MGCVSSACGGPRVLLVACGRQNRLTSGAGRAEWAARLRGGSSWWRELSRFETGEQHQIVGHDRGPDVGLEVIEAAPGAACQTVGSLEAGDPGLNAGAEVAQLAIDPAALDHVFDGQAALLVEGDIVDTVALAVVRLSRLAYPPSAATCR